MPALEGNSRATLLQVTADVAVNTPQRTPLQRSACRQSYHCGRQSLIVKDLQAGSAGRPTGETAEARWQLWMLDDAVEDWEVFVFVVAFCVVIAVYVVVVAVCVVTVCVLAVAV